MTTQEVIFSLAVEAMSKEIRRRLRAENLERLQDLECYIALIDTSGPQDALNKTAKLNALLIVEGLIGDSK